MSRFSNVMIVDDNEMDLFLNKMILETLQYSNTVTTYTNPVTALNFIKGLSSEKRNENIPEIIFLDINMPYMTGFEFLDEFQNLPEEIIGGIKFYLISSSEDPEDLSRITKYDNIIKYLSKPLDKNQII